jgi:hypothetical protein
MGMRNLLALGIGLLIAYWFDQHYYHGANSTVVTAMLHDIADGFK